MNVNVTDNTNSRASAAALGFFDGLHIGHQAVIGVAVSEAREQGLSPAVFTFSGKPGLPKFGGRQDTALITFDEKLSLMGSIGAEFICAADFDEVRELTPEEFFDGYIVDRLNAQVVVCGEDFRFGRGGKAGITELRGLCDTRGKQLITVPPICEDGVPVSSTRIRELIRSSDVGQASWLLGRWFSYTLPVLHGRKLGRTIGFPTINQKIPEFMVRPKHGVYASFAYVFGREYQAITDIGVKPTVQSAGEEIMETHIIGFDGDIYGENVKVALRYYIRGEERFSGLEELKAQLEKDRNASTDEVFIRLMS